MLCADSAAGRCSSESPSDSLEHEGGRGWKTSSLEKRSTSHSSSPSTRSRRRSWCSRPSRAGRSTSTTRRTLVQAKSTLNLPRSQLGGAAHGGEARELQGSSRRNELPTGSHLRLETISLSERRREGCAPEARRKRAGGGCAPGRERLQQLVIRGGSSSRASVVRSRRPSVRAGSSGIGNAAHRSFRNNPRGVRDELGVVGGRHAFESARNLPSERRWS